MASLKRHDGSSWVDVSNGTAVKHWDGSSWVNPDHLKYYDGAAWQTAWSKSDPKTYIFYATNSNSWRPSGWRSDGECKVGSYIYLGASYGDHITVMDFTSDTDDTTGIDFASAIATRPTCTSMQVSLYRNIDSGPSTTGTGDTWYLGQYDGTIGSGTASDDINLTDMTTDATTQDLWTSGTAKNFTLNTSLASALATKELWIANRTSGFSSTGGSDPSYSELANHSSVYKALITVTLDY